MATEYGAVKTALLLAALIALVASPRAAAGVRPDSDAPPGLTNPMWLPHEEWVMERWIPFDEDRLYDALRMSRAEVYWYLKPGFGDLRTLARSRGVGTRGFAIWLLGNRRRAVSEAKYKVLLHRTRRLLTQRHLAAHIIGHPWHRWTIVDHMVDIFGPEYAARRGSGVPIEEIPSRVNVPRSILRQRILSRLFHNSLRGVRTGDISLREAQIIRSQDEAQIEDWLAGRPQFLCSLIEPSSVRGSDRAKV